MAALRTITHQLPKSALASRSFSIAARRMAAGDTGATRAGGAAQGDAFTKREQANEADYVRKQELEKLQKRISDSEKQLAKDKKDAEELAKQK